MSHHAHQHDKDVRSISHAVTSLSSPRQVQKQQQHEQQQNDGHYSQMMHQRQYTKALDSYPVYRQPPPRQQQQQEAAAAAATTPTLRTTPDGSRPYVDYFLAQNDVVEEEQRYVAEGGRETPDTPSTLKARAPAVHHGRFIPANTKRAAQVMYVASRAESKANKTGGRPATARPSTAGASRSTTASCSGAAVLIPTSPTPNVVSARSKGRRKDNTESNVVQRDEHDDEPVWRRRQILAWERGVNVPRRRADDDDVIESETQSQNEEQPQRPQQQQQRKAEAAVFSADDVENVVAHVCRSMLDRVVSVIRGMDAHHEKRVHELLDYISVLERQHKDRKEEIKLSIVTRRSGEEQQQQRVRSSGFTTGQHAIKRLEDQFERISVKHSGSFRKQDEHIRAADARIRELCEKLARGWNTFLRFETGDGSADTNTGSEQAAAHKTVDALASDVDVLLARFDKRIAEHEQEEADQTQRIEDYAQRRSQQMFDDLVLQKALSMVETEAQTEGEFAAIAPPPPPQPAATKVEPVDHQNDQESASGELQQTAQQDAKKKEEEEEEVQKSATLQDNVVAEEEVLLPADVTRIGPTSADPLPLPSTQTFDDDREEEVTTKEVGQVEAEEETLAPKEQAQEKEETEAPSSSDNDAQTPAEVRMKRFRAPLVVVCDVEVQADLEDEDEGDEETQDGGEQQGAAMVQGDAKQKNKKKKKGPSLRHNGVQFDPFLFDLYLLTLPQFQQGTPSPSRFTPVSRTSSSDVGRSAPAGAGASLRTNASSGKDAMPPPPPLQPQPEQQGSHKLPSPSSATQRKHAAGETAGTSPPLNATAAPVLRGVGATSASAAPTGVTAEGRADRLLSVITTASSSTPGGPSPTNAQQQLQHPQQQQQRPTPTAGQQRRVSLDSLEVQSTRSGTSTAMLSVIRTNQQQPPQQRRRRLKMAELAVQVELEPDQTLECMAQRELGVATAEIGFRKLYFSINTAVRKLALFSEGLRNDLLCPHCYKLYDEPSFLFPCGHTFCKGCIETSMHDGELYICDVCRGATREGYSVNAALASMVARSDFYHSASQEPQQMLDDFNAMLQQLAYNDPSVRNLVRSLNL